MYGPTPPSAARPARDIVIERRHGVVHPPVPHLVVHHSLHGFACGYGGSGPADLAMNIVAWRSSPSHLDGQRQG